MWAGLDKAVPGCVWENNPGRELGLLLKDMGRESHTLVLHYLCLDKKEVQTQRVLRMCVRKLVKF